MAIGRPRKIKSVEEFERLWTDYKCSCDNQRVLLHKFSARKSEFVSKELSKVITYTVKGFCRFVGISRQAFHEYYANDERFADAVTRAKEEMEVDARRKFELGLIPTQLAGVWMSRYGYSTRPDSGINGDLALNELISMISEDAKEQKMDAY